MTLNADDIAEIINLAHEYNQAVDQHDPRAWTQTHTADGELRSPFGDDELVRVDGRWRFARRVHHVDPSYGGVEEHHAT
jgi:hypothetical protein